MIIFYVVAQLSHLVACICFNKTVSSSLSTFISVNNQINPNDQGKKIVSRGEAIFYFGTLVSIHIFFTGFFKNDGQKRFSILVIMQFTLIISH